MRILSEETKQKISNSLKNRRIERYYPIRSCGKSHSRCKICRPDLNWERKDLKKSLEDILLQDNPDNSRIKMRLIREGYCKNECEICGLGPEWNGKPLTLHLDHINGNKKDNRLENFRLLCPNCHSQTETFSWRNYRKKLVQVEGVEPSLLVPETSVLPN